MNFFKHNNLVSNSNLLLILIVFIVGNNHFFSQGGTLANPIFSENFGSLANNTTLTNTNTAFSYVRVVTGTVGSIPLGLLIGMRLNYGFADAKGVDALGNSLSNSFLYPTYEKTMAISAGLQIGFSYKFN